MIGPSGPGPNFGPNNPRMDLAAGEGRIDCPPGAPMRMDNFRSDNPRMDHGLASDFAALNLQIPNTTKVSVLFDFLKFYLIMLMHIRKAINEKMISICWHHAKSFLTLGNVTALQWNILLWENVHLIH